MTPGNLCHQLGDLRACRFESLFDKEPSIENRTATIRDARGLNAVDQLSAIDAIHVDGGVTRARRDNRHVRAPGRQAGTKIVLNGPKFFFARSVMSEIEDS